MARRPRENYPEQWHHVYGRGVAGRSIFVDDQDRAMMYQLLEKQVMLGRIVVFAFVLMTNHYHFLVKSPNGELDVAMRDLFREYVLYFNERHGRDGPLFKSRFQSRPVTTFRYKRSVLWYIDRNPVAAGLATRAVDYPHGSAYRFHRGIAPSWLNTEWVASVVEEIHGVVGMPVGTYGMGGGMRLPYENDGLVESRMRSSGTVDPMDGPLETEGERSRFLTRYLGVTDSELVRKDMPIATAAAILEVRQRVEAAEGPWVERVRGKERDLLLVATLGLLKRMAGCTVDEVAELAQLQRGLAARCLELHLKRLAEDPEYAARVHGIAREVLWGPELC